MLPVFRLALAWWNDRGKLSVAVSLETVDPDFFLYTDASVDDWGATVDHL